MELLCHKITVVEDKKAQKISGRWMFKIAYDALALSADG